MTAWTTLVQAEELAGRLGDPGLFVADCRVSLADRSAGPRLYAQSHVPGATYVDLELDLSDHRKLGQGRHPWPDAGDFTARLGAWGIAPDTQVVAYDADDGAFASRLWFLLRTLGHERVAVLDGGWARWVELGLPADSVVPERAPRHYAGEFDQALLIDAPQVGERLLAGDLLLDARAAPRFRGETEPLDRVAGHVPGARNRPYADNLANGRFKPARALAEAFTRELEGRDPSRAIMMCGSGVTACHNLLAMAHAGLTGARLFTGSWSGWIADPDRPVATGP